MIPHVAARLSVATWPQTRPWRAGACGRDRSDPPPMAPGMPQRRIGMDTPCHPPREVATGQRSFAGRPLGTQEDRVPALVGDAGKPDEQPVAQHPCRPPRSGARHPSGTDCWLGATPQRRGGWGCTSPSFPMPIEACRDGGSLPATASMAGSASPLRWPWHNRQRASDIRNRRRVHRRRDFVSGDPRSTMYTRGSASVRAPGGQNWSPDRRLERHHGEDVVGRDAIGVRLRLGDNPVADSRPPIRGR